MFQRTIGKKVKIHGIGLHTGEYSEVSFYPAAHDTGLKFRRTDKRKSEYEPVQVQSVFNTNRATSLGKENSVSTVEHCLASIAALGIDNLYIDINGPEMPILDGSSIGFFKLLKSAGVIHQQQFKKFIYVTRPVTFTQDDKKAKLIPYNGLRITITIDFPHPCIGQQTIDLDIHENSFHKELASAKTFGFLKDVEYLRSQGLIKGGSLDNAIVLDETKILNKKHLLFKDEFVRHKCLDALGDLATLGMPILGHLILYKSGHQVLNGLVNKLLSSKDNFRYVELGSGSTSMFREVYETF